MDRVPARPRMRPAPTGSGNKAASLLLAAVASLSQNESHMHQFFGIQARWKVFMQSLRNNMQFGVLREHEETVPELNKNPVDGFSAGLIDDNDLYRWEVLIIGPPDTLYEGGVFKAHLTFPKDYPLRPPKMKFITEIWHPNVDKNGEVCISILHEPGEDKYGYEKPEERWLPIHTVETILISVISMLADPNGDSPANVDAAKEWREDRNGEFKRKVARCVRKSQETAFE
ncbi:ubiquitin-conjugating enzyme E2 G1a isoform X1 [Hypanus sabinus]|uniref:ubiquitin-conjugating enzyme E2 G1a isoform X1 n=1 Tax=Hypanus sabinus TaxID=79690 RepID=UPI0028C3F5B3|nr:ubiquitin-conjugating enzyme E2 G1a isoform X1 [Hypanus sabinus]